MKTKSLFFWLIFVLLFKICIVGKAQSSKFFVVKGHVIDKVDSAPLPGVNVVVKGSTIGVITDVDGNFTIQVPKESTKLVFSMIGYVSKEIDIKGKQTVILAMEGDIQKLEEVVVIAYGKQNKGLVTSAIETMDNKELIKSPVASVTNSLSGALPGVATVQNSGQPGADAASIYVRGSGSLDNNLSKPLILVDGVEREFSQIDANEIESISILKDASATAVFGVRGANGVVMVTTKRGTSGKPQITVSSSLGLQQPLSLVEQVGSYEFARFWNMKEQMDGTTDPKRYFTKEQVEAYRTGSDPIMYPNIDWGDYLFNNLFLQSKNNVNISGGNDKIKYFISLGYLYQNGVLKSMPRQAYDNNYRYDRYNYRSNLDVKLTPTTTMKLGMGGHLGKTREPRHVVSGVANNPWTIAQIWSLPFAGPGFVNGVRTLVPQGLVPTTEVMRDGLFVFYGMGYTQNYKTTLNMDLELTQKLDFLLPGLSVGIKGAYDNQFNMLKTRAGGGVEYQQVSYKSYFETEGAMNPTDPDYDKTYVFTPVGADTPLTYSESNGRDQNWYIEARMDYERRFGKHKVTGLFLYNQSRNYYPTNYSGVPMSYPYIPRSYVGLVGRATWSYLGKYMVDMNVGYNGSENFAPGKNRFGVFPSFSAGWVLTGEKFMESIPWINFLKVRVAWGRVGNDQGVNSRFMYMPATWNSSGSYSFGVNNPVSSEAYVMGTPGNTEVTWETSDKQNYGLDVKFLDSRLSVNLDYFIEKRKGILIAPQTLPNIIATSSPNLNLGKVNNHGYEISLGWRDRIGDDFNYHATANVSYARNKIIYKDEVPQLYDYMNETGGSTGRHPNLYKFIRLYQYSDFISNENGNMVLDPSLPQPNVNVYPGDAMYADLNGDMKVDGNDRFITGYSERPEYIFGVNMGCEYKGLSLSMQWTGATHVNKMYEVEYRIPFTNSGNRGLLKYFYDGCWTPEHQLNAAYPRAAEKSESWNSAPSTLWLKDASYLRLKNLSVAYTFQNTRWLKMLGLRQMALSFSGYNLLTFSPLKHIDPESLATNNGGYPLVKIYSFGLNLNF